MQAQKETYIATSAKDVNHSIKSSINNGQFPNLEGNYSTHLFAYDDQGKTAQMLGIDVSSGFGSILAQGLHKDITLQFTDNTLRSYKGVLSDVDNFNTWIRDAKKDAVENNDAAVQTNLNESPAVLYTVDTRIPGTVSLIGNYELQAASPLDARTLTYTKDTLVDPGWWITAFKRPVYLYRGLIVSVKSTSELYMYTGIDICLKSNDITSKRAIALDNWKRVSFHQDDLANNSLLVLNHIEANKRNGIRTSETTSWKSDNTLFLSAEKSLNDIGATLATDYILLGSHYHYKSDYSVHREIFNIYKDSDNFMGLTIIPPEPYKQWPKKLYRNKTTGIELQSILSPLLLKYKYIDDPSVTPYTIGLTLAKEGIHLSSPGKDVSINAKNLDLSRIENISYGTFTQNLDALKMNVKNSVQGSGSMLTMQLTGGTYLSSGDETNIITGAFAIHTTGYTVSGANLSNSVLLNPVSFDLKKGTQGSAGYVVDIQSQKDAVNAVNPNKQSANNAKTASSDYPRTMTPRSAADFSTTNNARKTGADGSSPINNIVAPTTTANFNKIHNENLRLTPNLVAAFKTAVDDNQITLVDLSDKQNLTNPKNVIYASESEFQQEYNELLSSGEIKATDAENLDLKILNTKNEIWINSTKYLTGTGQYTTLNKGYTMIGNTATITEKIATNLTELINNGTISIESFGDVSIQSHFGQLKLGQDGFVRTNRSKYFVVENGEDSYLRTTPQGIELNYTHEITSKNTIIGPGVKPDENNYYNRGYIKLNAGSILLWDGYELEKPIGDDLILTYSNKDTGKALTWKTSSNVSGSITLGNTMKFAYNSMIITAANQTKIETQQTDWAYNRYQTEKCYLYKIGTFEYPGFDIPVNGDKIGTTYTETNVVNINANIQISLSSPLYSGNLLVDLQIYNSGKAKIAVTDQLIKYYKYLSVEVATNDFKHFTAPIIFRHTPTDNNKPGKIEFFLLSNNMCDCHWAIQITKETKDDAQKWISESQDTPRITNTDDIKNIIKNIYYPINADDKFNNQSPDTSLNISQSYIRPLLLSGVVNEKDASTNIWYNNILNMPSGNQTCYLQYNSQEGTFNWEPDERANNTGITTNYILKSNQSKEKIYVVGIYDSANSEKINWKLNNNTTQFHESIYYDYAGDLHASNFYSISDKRLKKDIQPLKLKENYLPPLKQFVLKNTEEQSYGFIAQEIEDAGYPELIHTDENGYKRVNYISAYAVLFKELQQEIAALKAEVQLLRSKNNY